MNALQRLTQLPPGPAPTLTVVPAGTSRPAGDGRRKAVLLAAALCGWAALVASLLPHRAPVEPVIVFAFVLTGPGAATLALLPVSDLLERAVTSVAVSVALGILVSEAFGFARYEYASVVIATLASLTTAACVYGWRHPPRRPGREGRDR